MESEIEAVREAHRLVGEADARLQRCNDAQREAERLYFEAGDLLGLAKRALFDAITGDTVPA